MQRVAFKMKIFKGCEAEYKKRHEALWPELKILLEETGIKNYSIFLEEETQELFGYFSTTNIQNLTALPQHPVMKKWWNYMKDVMETNIDNSPITINLNEVFYLP